MDALDRRILRIIQHDASLSAESLAEQCGSSPSTILRRLAQLRKEKIIGSQVAIIDAAAVGRPLQMIVRVGLKNETIGQKREFVDEIKAHPGVSQFYFVTGNEDYVIFFNARSMEEYDDFVQSLLISREFVKTAFCNVVIRPIKSGFTVPVDEPVAA